MPQTRVKDKQGKSAKWQARRHEIVDTSAKVFADAGLPRHQHDRALRGERHREGRPLLLHRFQGATACRHPDRVMDEVMLGADRVALAGGTPPEQLAMLGEELLDVIFRFPDHVWVFLHDFPALTGKNAEMFRQRRRAYERRVEAVFQQGVVESGDFRPLDTRLTVTAVARHAQLHVPVDASGWSFLGQGSGEVLRRHFRLGHRDPRISFGLETDLAPFAGTIGFSWWSAMWARTG